MATCSTWHVRIDLVDDGVTTTARARLIGAPGSITCVPGSRHQECLSEPGPSTRLHEWQPLDELASALADALGCEHHAHAN